MQQWLTLEPDGTVRLVNKFNLDPLLEDNYVRRMAVGKAKGSNFKPIASIPVDILASDMDGLAFLNAAPGSPEERMALQNFLTTHHEYRTSDVHL